jgi:hypothetical protein
MGNNANVTQHATQYDHLATQSIQQNKAMLIGRSATNDKKDGATAKVKQRIFDWLVGLQLQFLTVLRKAMETKAKLFLPAHFTCDWRVSWRGKVRI